MSDRELPDDLAKGCRRRDRSSQKELYKRFYGYGMSIALRYAGSRDEAASILNDSFLKVFESFHRFNPSRPFTPWFRRIVINTAINHYHRTRNEPDWQQLHADSFSESPTETIISGITGKEILAMVQQLPPAYRTVFNLYVMEGYTHREIAELLGIHEGTSKSNLFKAKQELRHMLEKNLNT